MKISIGLIVVVACIIPTVARLGPPKTDKGNPVDLTDNQRDSAKKFAENRKTSRKNDEKKLIELINQKGKKSLTFHERFTRLKKMGNDIVNKGRFILDERKSLISGDSNLKSSLDDEGTVETENCFVSNTDCSTLDDTYRTMDGTCNNKRRADWGSTFIPFLRHLRPKYSQDDGPRRGKNPRLISREFHTDVDLPNSDLTLLTMQMGQFLDHDITHTPTSSIEDETISLDCCDSEIASIFDDCFPIMITGDTTLSIDCMNFVRSAPISPVKKGECVFGPRQQMNQITAFVDASNVYGSDDETRDSLYDSSTGLMYTHSEDDSTNLLPTNEEETCGDVDCFRAGDERVNEQVDLTVMHTLFVREHNKIVNKISELRPTWDGEKKFKEARRVLAAIMQVIVYNNYLPAVLGNEFVNNNYKLSKSISEYDNTVDPSITNEFATAAYRFGHSQLQNVLKQGSISHVLHEIFFNPKAIYGASAVAELVQGLLDLNAQTTDRHFTEEVTDRLFEVEEGNAFDLVALNIQRGRDHGIPPYLDYKKSLNQNHAEDLTTENLKALNKIYSGISKVDLFTGGIAEKSINGGAVGQLFAEIIGEQFGRLKIGDRFFYNNRQHYSADAAKELERTSIGYILCRNAPLSSTINRNSFLADSGSEKIDCTSSLAQDGINLESIISSA